MTATIAEKFRAECPPGHHVYIARAKRLSDLQPGDVITGWYRPSTGRGASRIVAGISFMRYERDEP